jgi:hypothetical protein
LGVVANEQARDELRLDLDAIVREGARRMLAAALEAEVEDYLAAHAAERDEQGRRLVVRNGHARRREVLTAAGAVAARAPRVNDRRTDPVTGGRVGFRSVVCRFVSLTLLDDLHCDRPNNVVPEQLGLPTVRQEINRRGAKR